MKFGFIAHPTSPGLKQHVKMVDMLERLIAERADEAPAAPWRWRNLVPFMDFGRIVAAGGAQCEGIVHYMPLTAEDMLARPREITQRVIDGVDALKASGAELVGLGGFSAAHPALSPRDLRQIGIRSVDEGEKQLVHQAGIDVFDMRYIDEHGMRATMERALADMAPGTHLHVSLDVDFLDPDIAPGVATTIRGGPTYREAQLCMEMVADTGRMASLDIVEINPAYDTHNRTAELAVDLVESLFGKSTLMRRRG